MTATFRFYAELNEFIGRERRGQAFTVRCAQSATAKHMIEALGVPHTEVALLLVNGEPGRMDHLLDEGDRIAAYPAFARFDIAALAGADAAAPLRFVADAHLGALARTLRMAGFDTLYDNCFDDASIERLGLEEDRTVLTRDRELLKRRGVLYGCYVHALVPAEQFRELATRLGLARHSRPFSLCLYCNVLLREAALAEVIDRLPPAVRATQRDFRTCAQCGRVYWKGSHWKHMSELLSELLPARV